MEEGLHLRNEQGEVIEALQSFIVPDMMQAKGHRIAARYELRPPVQVMRGDELVLRLDNRSIELGQPNIEGKSQLQGLSKQVPPVFADNELVLNLPSIHARIDRAILVLKRGNDIIHQVSIAALKRQGNVLEAETHYQIQLQSIVPNNYGVYTLDLRYNLQQLVDAPLQFSIVPRLKLPEFDNQSIYSPAKLPQITLGLPEHQIQLTNRAQIIASDRHQSTIRWHDLRQPVIQLRVIHSNQQIPLAWQIERVFAWIGDGEQSVLSEMIFRNAELHIRGKRNQRLFLFIEGEGGKLEITLGAKGEKDSLIREHPLMDMLSQSNQTQVRVMVELEDKSRWELGRVERSPQLQKFAVSYQRGKLSLDTKLDRDWQGEFEIRIYASSERQVPIETIAVTKLDGKLELDCELDTGKYLLDILCDDVQLEIDERQRSFLVARSIESSEQRAASPEKSLNQTKMQAKEESENLLRQLEAGAELKAEDYYSLLTMPNTSLRSVDSAKLNAVSEALSRIVELHQSSDWVNEHGLLPAWAVTGHELWLRNSKFRHKLRVNPESLAFRGASGIGSVDLVLNGGLTKTVYAKWTRLTLADSQLEMMILDSKPEMPFSELDDDTLDEAYSVYLCVDCGEFAGNWHSTDPLPRTKAIHLHNSKDKKWNDALKNIVFDYKLLMRVEIERTRQISPAPYSPDDVLDKLYFQKQLRGAGELLPFKKQSNPMSRDAHLMAVSQCLQRYQTDSDFRMKLDEWMQNEQSRRKIDALWKAFEKTPFLDIVPMLSAAMRLIKVVKPESNYTPSLEYHTLMLAVLLRFKANQGQQKYEKLLSSANLKELDMLPVFRQINEIAPELLTWAVTWIELFHIHAIS